MTASFFLRRVTFIVSLSLLPIRRGGERDGEEVRGDSWRILRLNPVSGYIGSMMASPVPDSRRDYGLILEETELRLGPPGASCCADGEAAKGCGSGKRFFLETVDLKLNLSSEGSAKDDAEIAKAKIGLPGSSKPPVKSQAVGWPPLKSFRKNSMTNQKNGSDEGARFVKVSMDGAPYRRKVDLRMYKSYPELSDALANMFCCFIAGDSGSNGPRDFMNERKLGVVKIGSESVVTCEDKDGDWMLVGDLPWEMFVDSCKCLRIMKGFEAIGLG